MFSKNMLDPSPHKWEKMQIWMFQKILRLWTFWPHTTNEKNADFVIYVFKRSILGPPSPRPHLYPQYICNWMPSVWYILQLPWVDHSTHQTLKMFEHCTADEICGQRGATPSLMASSNPIACTGISLCAVVHNTRYLNPMCILSL